MNLCNCSRQYLGVIIVSASRTQCGEQVALKTPQQMVGSFTIAPNKLNAIKLLSKKLAEYAKARFYSPAEAVDLVQDFMLCFRYSRLMDGW